MRHAIATLLMVVLTLAGVGRGLAAVADSGVPSRFVPGVLAPICHAGGEAPATPTRHDCCDQCALCSPLALSEPPEVPIVSPRAHAILRSAVVAWAARLSRARSPRQSQGPPAA